MDLLQRWMCCNLRDNQYFEPSNFDFEPIKFAVIGTSTTVPRSPFYFCLFQTGAVTTCRQYPAPSPIDRRLASCSTNTSLRMVLPFSHTLVGLVLRASSPSGWTASLDPVRARSGSRFAIQPASRYSGSAARIGTGDYRCRPVICPIRNAAVWPALDSCVELPTSLTQPRPFLRDLPPKKSPI
jgi:hypothetical protein